MTQAISDRRLLPLVVAMRAKQFEVLSLDVFDTLLWRRVPEPKDIFVRVGTTLAHRSILRPTLSIVEFAELRGAAEKAARAQREAQTGSREVLLADIYTALPAHIWSEGVKPTDAAGIEVDIESRNMILDQEVAGLIDEAETAGVKVILSSDTYFTRAELVDFLSAAGLAEERIPETLYISNEQDRPKWRDLFDVVLKDLGVATAKLVHLGDNMDADVVPCASRGIAHVFYDKWAALPRTRAHELPAPNQERANWIVAGGDHGLTGLRSRLAHRPPLDVEPGLEPYWTYGAATLAPVFAAYGAWVIDSLQREGVSQAFGIMREGRFLNRVVSTVASGRGVTCQTTDVWLSRRAVVRAALWDDDLSLLPAAIAYCPGPTTDDILEQLGLTRDDLADTFKDIAAVDLHAPGGVDALLIAVSRSENLQSKIAAESGRRRENLLAYLGDTVDLATHQKLCLLDLGYAGTIQSALQKIFKRESVSAALVGLYVAINTKGRESIRSGVDLRALFGSQGYGSPLVRVLERTPDVLEHACMCVEGSLDTFEEGGKPVMLASQRDGEQIKQMEALQDGIIAGVETIMMTLGPESLSSPVFVEHAGNIIYQAMLRPTQQDAETIGSWHHEANFDLSDQRTLSDLRVDPAALEFGGAEAWTALQRHEAYWPAAALRRVAPHMVEAVAVVQDGSVSPDTLSSGALLGAVTVTPDVGVGFDEKRQVSTPLSLSSLGRAILDVSVKRFGPDACQGLRLVWPDASAVISIAACVVRFSGEGQSEKLDALPYLSFKGDVDVRGSVVTLGRGGGYALVALDQHTPSWPHALDLHLKFTYARLDRLF